MTLRWISPSLALFALGLTTFSQGVVSFNNVLGVDPSVRPYVRRYNGESLANGFGRFEVLDESGEPVSRQPEGSVFAFGGSGIFGIGYLSIPGTVPGGSTAITLRVWDASTGETYGTALEKFSVKLTLTGLGGGELPVPNLLEIAQPVTFPRLSAGVKEVRIEPIRDSDQLVVTGTVRPNARYRLDISTNLVSWTPVEFLSSGPMNGPPLPDWGPIGTVINQRSALVNYVRLVSGDDLGE
ncbi:MAG TPA: hypothetical protein DCE44_18765 [Verrucomicrobiales bacterium]|nr:hypothetical protein [Verrucomicrobiales bacterium]